MTINWFTFVAQVVNFFILVYLLRRFLYGPITRAMDEREAAIRQTLADAETAKRAATAAEAEFRRLRSELDEQHAALLANAEQEAEGRRKELVHQARAEVDDQQARWRQSLRQERESFLKELRQRTNEQLWSLARRILADLATADLERQVVAVFTQRLTNLEGPERDTLRRALAADDETVVVTTAFPLPEQALQQLMSVATTVLGDGAQINFVVAADVVAGIELKVGGYKITWSIRDYLQELEEKLGEAIDVEASRTAAIEGAGVGARPVVHGPADDSAGDGSDPASNDQEEARSA